jgi:ABC-type nickel/cobalt efflux system permease component RcnA
MRAFRRPAAVACAFLIAMGASIASAHPMGNLSVNHYARLEPGANGVDVLYVLDLAEIPTFELSQEWGVSSASSKAILDEKAAGQAREWVTGLWFTQNGARVTAKVISTRLDIIDGAGNLPVFRITSKLRVPAKAGRLEYEDRNYPTRAGWREIVVRPAVGAVIAKASNGSQDISEALTSYPQDPTKAPPQDTRAWVEWTVAPSSLSGVAKPAPQVATAAAIAAPAPAAPPVARDVRPAEPQAAGTVKRNDAISRILRMKEISWPLMATLIGLAFWFGALHALEPGHGKTMVAAYLVGERGTPKHAMLLGGIVTFTHTISVFILGIATMFLSRYILPERISKVLGIVSGLSIIWIGGMLLWRRARTLRAKAHAHSHTHPHTHDHHHDHAHPHTHDHHHPHDHHHHHPHTHSHTHDGHTHSHVPDSLSMSSLIALGASGGLVPCPSALILLLSAISIGRPGLGMILLVAFSLGLAIVLMSTGLAVLYAKNLLPERKRADNWVFRFMPVASAAAILVIGVMMTSVSLGLIPAALFIG